jgi:hypothetical protein
MWRILPKEEFVVLIKRNLGKSQSKDCPSGYTTVSRHPFQAFRIDETHELLTQVREIDGGEFVVSVWADWQEVLQVPIKSVLLPSIQGTPGIRTDNGRYNFRYFVSPT